jgi:hypothetical protein
MTLPVQYNPISLAQVNVELFLTDVTQVTLNQQNVRNLFQLPTLQTTISMHDGHGKSNIGPPKNPTFTNITQTSATVSWGQSEGICNKYTITVKDALTDTTVYGSVQNFTTLPLALTAALSGLVAATNFKVHLLASNTSVVPIPTAEAIVNLLTLENVPLTPNTPTVIVVDKNTLRVTASATYASSYDIYEVISGTDTLIITNVQVPYDHTVNVYSLHTYKVKGRSTGGVGPISVASAATRSLPDFPVVATNLSYGAFTNITSSTVAITWTLSTSPVIINQRVRVVSQSDNIERYNSGLLANSVTSNTTSSVLQPATLYNIYVDTINEAGTAISTALVFTTKTAQPVAPSSATATSQTSITVVWGATAGASSYVLYKDSASLGTQSSPYVDSTGITAYTTHSYQVAAVNVSGESIKSSSTSETSFPDIPVTVTNVSLTPDMNSISATWTAAATTSTRTVDNYRMYAYLTSTMTQIYDSGLLGSGVTTAATTAILSGWTQYTIRIYTINRASSAIYVDTNSTTLADLRPDPLTGTLTTVTGQEPNATNVASTQVTIGTFQPGYNTPGIAISTSTGQFQAGTSSLTTGWVTSANVTPDSSGNLVFQARMTASTSETTTVTSTYTLGGGTRTFSVTTRDPNPPAGVSATGGTGTATINWTNAGYTYIVTADTGQSKTVSNVGTVTLGDTPSTRLSGGSHTFYVYARNVLNGTSAASTTTASVTAMPLFSYTRGASSVDETPGTNSVNFGISTTNVATNTLYNWSITGSGIAAADFSSMYYTTTGGSLVSMTPALTGSFVVNSSGIASISVAIATDHLTEGNETLSFQLTGSPTGDFASSSITVLINDTSLNPDYSPAAFSFNGQSNVAVNTSYSSGSVTVTGLEPSWPVTVNASGGTVYAGTSSASFGPFSAATTINTDSSGQMVVNATVTSSSSYKSSASVTVYVGTGSASFSVTTTANEQVSVTSSVDQGSTATLSASGGNGSDSVSIYRNGLSGNVSSGTIGSVSLDSSGNYSTSTTTVNWGSASYSLTFSSTGHTVTSNTLTVKPVETVSMSISGRQITVSIGNGYPSTNWSVSSNGGTGTMSNYNASVSWPTQTLSSTSSGGTWSTTITVSDATWGTWYFSALFAGTSHTITSNTVTVVKTAPNVAPVMGTVTIGDGSLVIAYTIGTSTAGPIEGVRISQGTGSGNTPVAYGTSASGSGTISITGLTNGTGYQFAIAAYNSNQQGPDSVTVTKTPIGAPTKPTGVTAAAGADGTRTAGISFSVGNNGATIDTFTVYANGSVLQTVTASSSPISVSSVPYGSVYFQLYAHNSVGNGTLSDNSNTVSIKKAAPDSIPTINSVVNGNASFTVSFTVPVSTTGPVEGAAITGLGGSYGAAATWKTAISGSGSGSITVNSGLTNGTSYPVAVYTYNSDNANPYTSNGFSASPTAPTAPSAPVMGNISTSGAVTWTAPTSAGTVGGGGAATITGYTFTWYSGGSAISTQAATGTSATLSLPSSIYDTAFTVSMTATNSGGATSVASNSADPGGCGAVSDAGTGTTTQFEVNIGNPSPTGGVSSTSYEVRASSGGTVVGSWNYPVGTRQIILFSNLTAGGSYTASARRHTPVGPTSWVGNVAFGIPPTAPSISFTDSALYTQYTATITSSQSTLYYATSSSATQPAFSGMTSTTSPTAASLGVQTAGTKTYWWAVVFSSNGLYSTYTSGSHTAVAPAAPGAPSCGLSSLNITTFQVDVAPGDAHTGVGYRWKRGTGGTYSSWIYQLTTGSYTFPSVSTTSGAHIYIQAVATKNGTSIVSAATANDIILVA